MKKREGIRNSERNSKEKAWQKESLEIKERDRNYRECENKEETNENHLKRKRECERYIFYIFIIECK